jgi:hypothetical protein
LAVETSEGEEGEAWTEVLPEGEGAKTGEGVGVIWTVVVLSGEESLWVGLVLKLELRRRLIGGGV